MQKTKAIKYKGGDKKKINKDDLENNPLLRIDDNIQFSIEFANILNDPYSAVFINYDKFNYENPSLDASKLDLNSEMIVTARYYEYLAIARFKCNYIIPLITNDALTLKDIFQMIMHALRVRLLMNIPSIDVILEIEFKYNTYIKYR